MEEKVLTVNGKAFTVLRLLGKGKGGYSYLVSGGAGEAVVKQIHHEPCAYYQFGDKLQAELHDYRRLQAAGIPLPALLDADVCQERILKEYIARDTVFDLICQNEMRPEYLEQVRAMCRLLYPVGLNIDYFPTNFVVREGKVYYIDFECNEYQEQWDFQHWGEKYWSRTPEFLDYLRQHGSSCQST